MNFYSIIAVLLPLSYLCHCFEEFYYPGGFIQWYRHFRPQLASQTPKYYFWVNLIAFMIVLVNSFFYFMTNGGNIAGEIIASSFLAWNAIVTHLIGAIKSKQYSPGLITGLILYVGIYLALIVITYRQQLFTVPMLLLYSASGILYELWNLFKQEKNAL